jgi:Phage integrase family
MESMLLDAAGHRRSPATMPGHHRGRPPRNKGERYLADPPTVEEIIAVMRTIGDRADGHRLRALIVLLWRAGLRISEALALQESDLDRSRGAVLVRRGKGGKRREVGMDRCARGAAEPMAEGPPRTPNRRSVVRNPRADCRASVEGVGPAQAIASSGRRGGCQTAVRTPPTPARPRGGDGSRGRSARGDSASAWRRQSWDHQRLTAGHRQQRVHQHRPWTAVADDLGHCRARDDAIDHTRSGRPRLPPTGPTAYPRQAGRLPNSARHPLWLSDATRARRPLRLGGIRYVGAPTCVRWRSRRYSGRARLADGLTPYGTREYDVAAQPCNPARAEAP